MLTDINFQIGEIQDFIVEISTGILNSPIDIVFDDSAQTFILEATITGGNIFIMSE